MKDVTNNRESIRLHNLQAVIGLKPQFVWDQLVEISLIPRDSGHEEEIAKYIIDLANSFGCTVESDGAHNVLVRVPVTPGYEDRDPICLQSHIDMVSEPKGHDFSANPVRFIREGNVIKAVETTLGADDGIGVAAELAVMIDPDVQHGPLELLFTTDEERGLNGVKVLAFELESKKMINLDSEDWPDIFVGCAGGRTTAGTLPVIFRNLPEGHALYKLGVSGLKGGHSGLEIHENRGNAIKIIGEIIDTLVDEAGAMVSSINGGSKHNAIPSSCEALLFIPSNRVEDAKNVVEESTNTFRDTYANTDPELAVVLEELNEQEKANCKGVMDGGDRSMVLSIIHDIRHGVIKMSEIPGLVQTSMNLAIVKTTEDSVVFTTSQRSMSTSELDELNEEVDALFGRFAMAVEYKSEYPAWQPNMNSPLLATAKDVYTKLFGEEPKVKTVHAGLECAIICQKHPNIDTISFGPTIKGNHAPGEMVYIDTVEKFWNFLVAMLKNV